MFSLRVYCGSLINKTIYYLYKNTPFLDYIKEHKKLAQIVKEMQFI